MKRPNFEKVLLERKIPVYIYLLTILLGIGLTVIFGGIVRHNLLGNKNFGALGETISTIAEFPSLVKQVLRESSGGGDQVIADGFPFLDGFYKSGKIQKGALEDNGYLLLSSYDKDIGQSSVSLIRIADQKVLHEWVPDLDVLSKIIGFEIIKSSFRIFHPLLLEDGGLYCSNAGRRYAKYFLFKINFDSTVEWIMNVRSHHSIEEDADGNIFVCANMESSNYNFSEDNTIVKISPDREILYQKSVATILIENGYQNLLILSHNNRPQDPLHLNDIQPALTGSEYWEKGDLLISVPGIRSIFLFRPNTDKIIWMKTGPWQGQHDVDYISDHEISVFGNHSIPLFKNNDRLEKQSYVMVYDFITDSVTIPYKDIMESIGVYTRTEGLSEILLNGDVFIEEQNNGRLLRLMPEGVKWEFVRRVDKDHLSMLSWSRYLTENQVRDFLSKLQQPRSNQ